MAKIYASTVGEISKREQEHLEKVREIAAQGMVLLENDGSLPLKKKSGRIALFGSGARRTVRGGTGSGEVNCRTVISVEQGLENAGFTIVSKDWMDSYDEMLAEARAAYFAGLKKQEAEIGVSAFMLMMASPFHAPDSKSLTMEDVKGCGTDTAIYVLARNSGEGADRYVKEGDYLLTQGEIQDLTFLGQKFAHLVVVLNVGGVIDAMPLKRIPGIGAVLLMSQAGSAGGDAVADILTGKVTPSGKLTTTWAKKYEDYPSAKTFSHNNGDVDDEWYEEGIYVGYRYFDTFGVEPAYCFGYGKSYTEFALETLETVTDSIQVSIRVKVTNTGEQYGGREVVQVYYSAPDGELEKPYQELAAYAKTKVLMPGESQELTLQFQVQDMASYSEEKACWVLEKGDYIIRVGNSSRSTKVAAVIELSETVATQKVKNLICDKVKELSIHGENGKKEGNAQEENGNQVNILRLDAEILKEKAVQVTYDSAHPVIPKTDKAQVITAADVREGCASLEELVSQLSVEEMADLCVGTARGVMGAASQVGASSAAVPGAAGDTTSLMEQSRDIRNMVLADGPAGLRLSPQFHTRNGQPIQEVLLALDGVEELLGNLPKPDLTGCLTHYQYCTSIPIATLLAQTWDVLAIQEAGSLVGREMQEFGVTLWLAPGMNIHRNPLCGRNFEYYSEDPFVSGLCAAADTKGVQSHHGVGTTIKHFAANNQEDNRNYSNSHVSERALREIYLKGFEICVRKAQPMSIMTSYNLLNGIHTANDYNLLTAVARQEWGFEGLIMTDWGTTKASMATMSMGNAPAEDAHKYGYSGSPECIKAGNDLIMPGSQQDVDLIVEAVKEGKLSLGDLQWCAGNILRVLLASARYDEN